MDSPTRNFLGLVGTSAALAAYPVCGFIAYVLIPLLGLSPGALAHLGPVCLLPAIALTVLVGTSAGLAARTLGRQMSASRRLSGRVRSHALPPPPELSAVAKASGLDGRVTVLDSPEQFSFVYGILIPRVAIGRGFLESLTAEELRAALEHERYHVRHLDPITVSLADPGLLDARISRLETGRAPVLASVGIQSLLSSALGACSFLLLLIAAVIGLGGTSALASMAADELSTSGTLLGALCAAPVVALVGLVYWRLARRASEPLPPGNLV